MQIPQCAIQFLSGLIRDDEAMLPAINANELSRLVWGIAMLHTTRYFNDLQHTTSAWPWERMDSSALELASQFSHEVMQSLKGPWAYLLCLHAHRSLCAAETSTARPGLDFRFSCRSLQSFCGPTLS